MQCATKGCPNNVCHYLNTCFDCASKQNLLEMVETYSRWNDSSCERIVAIQKKQEEEIFQQQEKNKLESWKKDTANVIMDITDKTNKFPDLRLDPRYTAYVDGKVYSHYRKKDNV